MIRYCITDRHRVASLRDFIASAFAAGFEWLQIREKDLPPSDLADLVTFAMLVNSRLDVALAVGADGCHWPGNQPPIQMLRGICPAGFLLGSNVHSEEEADWAKVQKPDYVLISPVFSVPDKAAPLGLSGFQRLAARSNVTAFALGGVTMKDVEQLAKAGASGVAGIRLFS
jgi:thiamine-phosphate pyrophosphorylase